MKMSFGIFALFLRDASAIHFIPNFLFDFAGAVFAKAGYQLTTHAPINDWNL